MDIKPISIETLSPIEKYNSPMFNSQMKVLFKKGKLPINKGLYGGILTPKNVTDEHIVCKCFGGTNDISNIALATAENNNKRGNQPIENFLNLAMIREYLKQFKGLKAKGFDGDSYIKKIKETLRRLIND